MITYMCYILLLVKICVTLIISVMLNLYLHGGWFLDVQELEGREDT